MSIFIPVGKRYIEIGRCKDCPFFEIKNEIDNCILAQCRLLDFLMLPYQFALCKECINTFLCDLCPYK